MLNPIYGNITQDLTPKINIKLYEIGPAFCKGYAEKMKKKTGDNGEKIKCAGWPMLLLICYTQNSYSNNFSKPLKQIITKVLTDSVRACVYERERDRRKKLSFIFQATTVLTTEIC